MEQTKYIIVDDDISDGYHTFTELYNFRHQLFIALANTNPNLNPWKSEYHSDGEPAYEDYFIAGLTLKGKDITFHLPIELWKLLICRALSKAPEWDGHTSEMCLERLKEFNKNTTPSKYIEKLKALDLIVEQMSPPFNWT
jgi:hypothetical protein